MLYLYFFFCFFYFFFLYFCCVFFFNDTATTEIYTLSLHDALPISPRDVEHLSRIVTLSRNTRQRNITLGQRVELEILEVLFGTRHEDHEHHYEIRSADGTSTKELTHVVFTRAADGTSVLYINGEIASAEPTEGTLSDWDPRYRLALGNEPRGRRGWLGQYRLVAIYQRALRADEIEKNLAADRRKWLE